MCPKVGEAGSEENTRLGYMNSVSQVDGDSDMVAMCICLLEGGGLFVETMASASFSIQKKAAAPTLLLHPKQSVPPPMSLVPFKLLPQCCSSERVNPSASEYVHGPFMKSPWDCSHPLSHPATISAVFHSQKL